MSKYPDTLHEHVQCENQPTDTQMLDWLANNDGRFANIDRITSLVKTGVGMFNGHNSLRAAIAAAMKERP